MAQNNNNPLADQLKEQDDREKLAEELRRAERKLMLAKARFDPQAFLTDSQQEQQVALPQQREAELAGLQAALSSGVPAQGQLPAPGAGFVSREEGIPLVDRIFGAPVETVNILLDVLQRLTGEQRPALKITERFPTPFR